MTLPHYRMVMGSKGKNDDSFLPYKKGEFLIKDRNNRKNMMAVECGDDIVARACRNLKEGGFDFSLKEKNACDHR